MKKSILEIYAMLVCLVSLFWGLVAIGSAAYNVIAIKNPSLTVANYEYSRYLSNEGYEEFYYRGNSAAPKLTLAEIEKKRAEGARVALEEEQRTNQKDLIKNMISILITALAFAAHWILAKRTRQTYLPEGPYS